MRTPRLAGRLGLAVVLAAGLIGASSPAPALAKPDKPFPAVIDLPAGFQPEGIAIGSRPVAWVGSLADGDIYEIDLRSGRGRVASQGPGTPSVGLKSDRRGRLFVAGGDAGDARVVDLDSGEILASYDLGADESFVNDVVLTRRAAYFTDSAQALLYALPLGKKGALPDPSDVVTLALGGEWVQGTGFGANGISTTPDHQGLLVVNSTTGLLYRVDPASGVATEVDLDVLLTNGDGLLRRGRTLFVVQNQLNKISVLRLDAAGNRARLTRTISSPAFDVPTTVARFGDRLYLPNARFGTTPTPTTPYTVAQVRASR
jgi:sugar lactone lactonase YvrE